MKLIGSIIVAFLSTYVAGKVGSSNLRHLTAEGTKPLADYENDKCTTIVVGPKAGAQGTMTTHTADCADCDFRLGKVGLNFFLLRYIYGISNHVFIFVFNRCLLAIGPKELCVHCICTKISTPALSVLIVEPLGILITFKVIKSRRRHGVPNLP